MSERGVDAMMTATHWKFKRCR